MLPPGQCGVPCRVCFFAHCAGVLARAWTGEPSSATTANEQAFSRGCSDVTNGPHAKSIANISISRVEGGCQQQDPAASRQSLVKPCLRVLSHTSHCAMSSVPLKLGKLKGWDAHFAAVSDALHELGGDDETGRRLLVYVTVDVDPTAHASLFVAVDTATNDDADKMPEQVLKIDLYHTNTDMPGAGWFVQSSMREFGRVVENRNDWFVGIVLANGPQLASAWAAGCCDFGDSYDLASNNCCHFVRAILNRMGLHEHKLPITVGEKFANLPSMVFMAMCRWGAKGDQAVKTSAIKATRTALNKRLGAKGKDAFRDVSESSGSRRRRLDEKAEAGGAGAAITGAIAKSGQKVQAAAALALAASAPVVWTAAQVADTIDGCKEGKISTRTSAYRVGKATASGVVGTGVAVGAAAAAVTTAAAAGVAIASMPVAAGVVAAGAAGVAAKGAVQLGFAGAVMIGKFIANNSDRKSSTWSPCARSVPARA